MTAQVEAPATREGFQLIPAVDVVGTEAVRLRQGEFDDVVARTGHWTKYDCVYNIPYRTLLPRAVDNLLVAGRCISVDHRVHHATKEIPPCMATGEAAGTAAALAVESGVDAKQVNVSLLQKRLRDRGAILG